MVNKHKIHYIKQSFAVKLLLVGLLSSMLNVSFAKIGGVSVKLVSTKQPAPEHLSPTLESAMLNSKPNNSQATEAKAVNKHLGDTSALLFTHNLITAQSDKDLLNTSKNSGKQTNVNPDLSKIMPERLSLADSDANEMNRLKRQLELAKIKAQINKASDISNPRAIKYTTSNSSTLVTAVIIDKEHPNNSVATLLFDDGGTLDVGLGNRLGGYIVSEINLDGVVLAKSICKSKRASCIKRLQIKRIYASTLKAQDSSKVFVPYSATHVLGSADSDSTSTTSIPPIVLNIKGK